MNQAGESRIRNLRELPALRPGRLDRFRSGPDTLVASMNRATLQPRAHHPRLEDPARRTGARVFAMLAGCLLTLVGPAACSNATGQAPVEEQLQVFDSARAWKLLENLVAIGPRPAGSPGAEQARVLIENQLSASGLHPEREAFEVDTPAGRLAMCNVYADLTASEGAEDKAPIVLLVSHYDTKRMEGFVGANDGGSSTAVLLELARTMAKLGGRRTTYRFVFVDGEEATREFWQDPDNCYGSRHHAQGLAASELRARVKAAVVIDMIGDKDLGLIEDFNSSPNLLACFFDAARAHGLGKHVAVLKEAVADDHLSFKNVGIASCVLIDLRYGPNGTNAWWHTTEDTLDKCAPESLRMAAEITLRGLRKVDDLIHKSK